MKSRIWVASVVVMFAALAALPVPVHGTQSPAPADQHADHHPDQAAAPAAPAAASASESQAGMMASMMASMKASNAKLDGLVVKMNAATGAAKTDAIAELVTAIVQEHRTMQESMMSHMSMMSNMMDMPGGRGGRGDAGPMMPKK